MSPERHPQMGKRSPRPRNLFTPSVILYRVNTYRLGDGKYEFGSNY